MIKFFKLFSLILVFVFLYITTSFAIEVSTSYKPSLISHILIGFHASLGFVSGIASFDFFMISKGGSPTSKRYFVCVLVSFMVSVALILSLPVAMSELYLPYDYSRYQNSISAIK